MEDHDQYQACAPSGQGSSCELLLSLKHNSRLEECHQLPDRKHTRNLLAATPSLSSRSEVMLEPWFGLRRAHLPNMQESSRSRTVKKLMKRQTNLDATNQNGIIMMLRISTQLLRLLSQPLRLRLVP
jgi:hypothetical protein